MDRELPQHIIHARRIKALTWTGAAVMIVFMVFWGLRSLVSPSVERSRILTSVAEIGDIEATIAASGTVVPGFEEVLTSPISSTVGAVHFHAGDSVHAGQSILQLNTEQLQLAYQKVTDELNIQKNIKEKQSLELARQRSDLAASYDIKVLEEKFTASKYDRAKHLFDIGGITKADLDLAAMDLEIVRRELTQLADRVKNQEDEIAAELRQQDLQIRVRQNQQSEIERQLSLAGAPAGRDGIITWVNDSIGTPVNAGDVIARVADLSGYKIEATISDIHAGKLSVGGPVNVRVRDQILRGRIAAIRPSVRNGAAAFSVTLDDASDPSLRPNLRVDVSVVTSTVDQVVRVKNGPFYNGSVDQEIFVVDGDHAERRIVNIGVSNFDWVELLGDIKPGDEVIVSDTKEYRNASEIAIR